VHPFYFEFPSESRNQVTIVLPPVWSIQSTPGAQNLHQTAAAYRLQVSGETGELQIERLLQVNIIKLGNEKYASFRDFFQKTRAADQQQVVLLPPG
jgi:hypothetical protein